MSNQDSDRANLAPSIQKGTDAADNSLIAATHVECWRCGKQVESDLHRCPFCSAILSATKYTPIQTNISSEQDSRLLIRVMIVYGCMLITSIIMGLLDNDTGFFETDRIPPSQPEVLTEIIIFEGLDTALVLLMWPWIRVGFREPCKKFSHYTAICIMFLPILAASLFVNLSYHRLLREWLNLAPVEYIFAHDSTYLGWWLLVICFQPAIIEELFFRGLAFGALRRVCGAHAVVWITSIMFALAHIGVPLSMPVLFMVGLVLGYSRLLSGGIGLPMMLHFIHNFVIVMLDRCT
jgi:uncharacterized protein